MEYNRRVRQDNNHQDDNNHALKRVSIEPEIPMDKLERHEIGIKSGLKGSEIKQYVDTAVYKLVYLKNPKVTLKAIGNACSKVLSIADIITRKVKDIAQIHSSYSRKYIAKYESEDGLIKKEKEFRLPCLDIVLTFESVDPTTQGYFPPLKYENLDRNYIDPANPPFDSRSSTRGRGSRGRGGFRGGFRGRGFNNQSNGFRGSGRGRGYFNQERGGFRGYRGMMRGRGRGRGRGGYFNRGEDFDRREINRNEEYQRNDYQDLKNRDYDQRPDNYNRGGYEEGFSRGGHRGGFNRGGHRGGFNRGGHSDGFNRGRENYRGFKRGGRGGPLQRPYERNNYSNSYNNEY